MNTIPWLDTLAQHWSQGKAVPESVRPAARLAGLPEQPPVDPITRVRLLALLTDADPDTISAVAPELADWEISNALARIPETAYEIIRLHRQGATPVEMGNRGITRTLVYYWLDQVGFTPHRRNRKELSARQFNEVIEAYEAGEPMASIARTVGLTYDQVRHAIRSREVAA